MIFTPKQKQHIRKLIKRYQRFIDATSECRYCGSACEMCYRRAMAKRYEIKVVSFGSKDFKNMKINHGGGGGGGGKSYNDGKCGGGGGDEI